MNNKGMTLIELIVSVALISVVLLFMYRLMADIEYDTEQEYFASQNQEQRIEIIDYIYEATRGKNVSSVSATSTSGTKTGNITISLTSPSVTYNINVQEKTLTIKRGSTTVRSWEMKNAYLDPNVTCDASGDSPQAIFYECNIKVYTDNTGNMLLPGNGGGEINNNNRLDDISFIVMKKKI